jgi:hypothetical protein
MRWRGRAEGRSLPDPHALVEMGLIATPPVDRAQQR